MKRAILALAFLAAIVFVGCGSDFPMEITIKFEGADGLTQALVAYGSGTNPTEPGDTLDLSGGAVTKTVELEKKEDIAYAMGAIMAGDTGKLTITLMKGDEEKGTKSTETAGEVILVTWSPSTE